MQIDLVAVIVDEYDPAIAFFIGVHGVSLVEDSRSLTNDGRPKDVSSSDRRTLSGILFVVPPGNASAARLATR